MTFITTDQRRFYLILILAAAGLAGCELFSSADTKEITACTNAVSSEWTYLGLGNEVVQTIAVDPGNAAHIMVGTSQDFSAGVQGKIFRSTDCGESWLQVWEGGSVSGVVFDPKDPRIVYASPHGIIRSEDGGKTWKIIDEGLAPYLGFTQRAAAVAIDPQDTRRIYVSTAGFGAGWLFYSDNRGDNWHPVPGRGDLERDVDDNRTLNNGIVSPILINPSNTDELFVSTSINFDFLRSMDRGKSWFRKAYHDSGSPIDQITFTPDHTEIVGMVRHFEGYFQGGLFTYNIAGDTWQIDSVPDSLDIAVRGIDFWPQTNQIIRVSGFSGKMVINGSILQIIYHPGMFIMCW